MITSNYYRLLISILSLIVLQACTWSTDSTPGETAGAVIKSPMDQRDYRHLTLANGMKVLLISDPDTEKSAAAVDVGAGSLDDPDAYPGMAHLLEHMLVIYAKNKKYTYVEYIQDNGGYTNAYTDKTHTNFYFEINSDKLHSALNQLAQLFISPALDPEDIEQERHGVDAEYRQYIGSDIWRLMRIRQATANPEHPISRFSIGSLETLSNADGQTLRQSLKDFYDRHYVAGNMSMVIYGREDTATLEQWFRDLFKGLPDAQPASAQKAAICQPPRVKPYTARERGVRINMEPLEDTPTLLLDFPMPSTIPYYRQNPLGYITRLLEYKGKGSLLSLLKQHGLANDLAIYPYEVPCQFNDFSLRIALTEKGLTQVDEITAMVFDYLHLIRQQGVHQSLYDENRDLTRQEFQFQDKGDVHNMVSQLAASLRYLPAENSLNGSNLYSLYEDYQPGLIHRFLAKMTPANLRQVVMAKGLATDSIEPFFQIRYSVSPLPQAALRRFAQPKKWPALAIAQANPFIAHDFNMRTDAVCDRTSKNSAKNGSPQKEPQRLLEKPGKIVWSLTDSSFGLPKASVVIKLSTPMASSSPENIMGLKLYLMLLSSQLEEYTAQAMEAGLDVKLESNLEGLLISLEGYQDKQLHMLKRILAQMAAFNPDQAAFNQSQEQYLRYFASWAFQPPYSLAIDALWQSIFPNHRDHETLLAATRSVTLAQLRRYQQDFFSRIHMTMLVYGNHSQQEALTLAETMSDWLDQHSQPAEPFRAPLRLLGDQPRLKTLDCAHDDAFFLAYYQRPQTSIREQARYELLASLLATPFFNSLRTEQQLGYTVFAYAYPIKKHPGFIFSIQSPVADPQELQVRVNRFLKQQKEPLGQLTKQELKTHQQKLKSNLLRQDANPSERAGRFWHAINNQESFDHRYRLAQEIERLTVTDITQALTTLMEDKPLVVRSFGRFGRTAVQDNNKDSDNRP